MNDLNHSMTCETRKEAWANAVSMDTLGPMLLRLCKRFWIFFFWISFFDELSMPNDDLKSISPHQSPRYTARKRGWISPPLDSPRSPRSRARRVLMMGYGRGDDLA